MNKQQKIRFPIYKGGHFVCPFLNSNDGEKYIHHITSTGLCKLHVIGKQWNNNISLDDNVIGDKDDSCNGREHYNYDIEFNGRLDFNDRIYDGDNVIIYNKSDRHIFIEIEYYIDEDYDEDISYKNNTIKNVKGFEFFEHSVDTTARINTVLDRKFKLFKLPECNIVGIEVTFDTSRDGNREFKIEEVGFGKLTIYEDKIDGYNVYKELGQDTLGLIGISNMSTLDNKLRPIRMSVTFKIKVAEGRWYQYPY